MLPWIHCYRRCLAWRPPTPPPPCHQKLPRWVLSGCPFLKASWFFNAKWLAQRQSVPHRNPLNPPYQHLERRILTPQKPQNQRRQHQIAVCPRRIN